MPEIKCAMDKDCNVSDVVQKNTSSLWWIDLIREVTRNLLGVVVVVGVLWMLHNFVRISGADDRTQIMMLVIGYLGGLLTGVSTWYFGGAMRSAMQAAMEQAKTATPPPVAPVIQNVQENKKPDTDAGAVG